MEMDFHSSHLEPSDYRADIDGLRAVAVLSVLIYHVFPLWLPGGFVGVDVFFVISGFLISRLIIDKLTTDRFSFVDFYARRVKRIFPALWLVLALSYGLGWWVLLADEFAQLGGHIAGGAGFVANLLLWHEAGYFDNASDTKPLLHLWSLGIEEQFYLLWPCLLWFAHRRRWSLPVLLCGLALCSFGLNIATVERDAVAAFYAPHTRFWELCVGALLTSGARAKRSVVIVQGAGLIGVSMVIASVFLINDTMLFPGRWAVLPVAGAALTIAAGPQAWSNRLLLSARPMVWLGLISYPLYLWHWPLLSFARVVGNQTPDPRVGVCVALAAVVLAWLTFEFVERPLRSARRGGTVAAALVTAMTAIALLGYFTLQAHGLPARPPVAGNAANAEQLKWGLFHSPACDRAWGASMDFCLGYGQVDAPRIVVLGDSTANALAPGLGTWAESQGAGLVNVGSFACPPVRGLVASADWKMGRDCLAGTRRVYARIAATPSIEVVVLALFAHNLKLWGISGVAANAPLAQRFAALQALIEADIHYLRAAGKRVIVTYDMPFSPTDARHCIPRPLNAWLVGNTSVCYSLETDLRERQPYLSLFDGLLSGRDDLCMFRQSELLLRDGRMHFADEQGRLLMRDDHHLSVHGSARMAELLVQRCGVQLH